MVQLQVLLNNHLVKGDEQLCKRYYQQYNNITGYAYDNTAFRAVISFPVEIRSAPTLTISNTGTNTVEDIGTANRLTKKSRGLVRWFNYFCRNLF